MPMVMLVDVLMALAGLTARTRSVHATITLVKTVDNVRIGEITDTCVTVELDSVAGTVNKLTTSTPVVALSARMEADVRLSPTTGTDSSASVLLASMACSARTQMQNHARTIHVKTEAIAELFHSGATSADVHEAMQESTASSPRRLPAAPLLASMGDTAVLLQNRLSTSLVPAL